jgi:hypothetical protein
MFCPSCRREIVHPPNEEANIIRVETFAGAACLTNFAVIQRAGTNIAGLLSAFQSGSPPGRGAPYPSLNSLNAAPRYLSVSLGTIDSSDSDSRVSSAARPQSHAPILAAS